MAYEHKPGSFALFKNDKEGNEKRPDYTGDGMSLDGKPIKVSAWLKEGKSGKFMSCVIQEKTKGEPAKNDTRGNFSNRDEIDQEIPF